ncbi:MAG: YihY/virulence factor BrkB family protein, partial [Cyanobacteria bacterium]|nr:YihY/virulence factor BrkB family protein [Cyanobacteriota bacterium]
MAKRLDAPKLFAWPNIGHLSLIQLASRTIEKFIQHDIATKAAAIGFYSMLAMVPLLTVVLTLFTHLLGYVGQEIALKTAEQSAAIKLFEEAISKLMPGSAYEVVESQIIRLSAGLSATLISVSLTIALWTASSVFATICKTMDQIYAHEEQRSFWRLRFAAFFVMLSQSSVLIFSLCVFFFWPMLEFSVSLNNFSFIFASTLQWLLMSVVV